MIEYGSHASGKNFLFLQSCIVKISVWRSISVNWIVLFHYFKFLSVALFRTFIYVQLIIVVVFGYIMLAFFNRVGSCGCIWLHHACL